MKNARPEVARSPPALQHMSNQASVISPDDDNRTQTRSCVLMLLAFSALRCMRLCPTFNKMLTTFSAEILPLNEWMLHPGWSWHKKYGKLQTLPLLNQDWIVLLFCLLLFHILHCQITVSSDDKGSHICNQRETTLHHFYLLWRSLTHSNDLTPHFNYL